MSVATPDVGSPHVAERRRLRLLGKRFLRRPMAMAGLIVVSGFVIMAIFAPLLAPYAASYTDFNAVLAHPSPQHLLGRTTSGTTCCHG